MSNSVLCTKPHDPGHPQTNQNNLNWFHIFAALLLMIGLSEASRSSVKNKDRTAHCYLPFEIKSILSATTMAHEPYVVELDPDTKTILKMYLFQNVENVEVIRNNIIQGIWSCAAIKPQLITEPFQVAVAANRAVLSQKQNVMVTRTVFSEILYNLSISKNITQSLSKFGIEKDTKLLICFLITEESDASKEILPQIEGDLLPMSDLIEFTCKKTLNNVYKLNSIPTDQDLTDVIVSRMVTKNFVTH